MQKKKENALASFPAHPWADKQRALAAQAAGGRPRALSVDAGTSLFRLAGRACVAEVHVDEHCLQRKRAGSLSDVLAGTVSDEMSLLCHWCNFQAEFAKDALAHSLYCARRFLMHRGGFGGWGSSSRSTSTLYEGGRRVLYPPPSSRRSPVPGVSRGAWMVAQRCRQLLECPVDEHGYPVLPPQWPQGSL